MEKLNRSLPKLDTDLISLRAFVAIVDEGSFSAAAKKVGRTQSTVSVQIAKLEERLDAKLFERTSRTIALTEEGEKFISYARRVLELMDEAMLSISAPDVHELFRIGFAEYLAPKHLHRLLAQFRRAHPKVDLKLHLGSGADLHKVLAEGNLDLVVSGPEFEGGQLLFTEPLVWVASKNREFDDIAIHKADDTVSLILMPPPCSYRKAAYDSLTAENLRFELTMEANSVQGVQSAVAAGLGLTVLAKSAVSDDLQIVDDLYPGLPDTSAYAFTHPNAPQALVDRFLTFLVEGVTSRGIGE